MCALRCDAIALKHLCIRSINKTSEVLCEKKYGVISCVAFPTIHIPFKCDILPSQEPPCRICSRLTPPPVFNPRALESRYKSSVTRRREYDPRRYDAKVGTDLKSELDSRFYNVGRIANKVQELKRNLVQDYDESKYFDREVI